MFVLCRRRALSLSVLSFLLCPIHSLAKDVTLAWDANTDPNASGYKIYYGTASGVYSGLITTGAQTSYTVRGLSSGRWYFAVTALDDSGAESPFSNEVNKQIDPPAPSPDPSPTPTPTPTPMPIPTPAPVGAATYETSGNNATTQVGYAKLATSLSTPAVGAAVFSLKENGITVSEAAIPVAVPTNQARIFIDLRAGVNSIPGHADAGTIDINTGIAVVNYGSATANLIYTLRDSNGNILSIGHGTVSPGNHFSGFVDQLRYVAPDFAMPADFSTATQFGSLDITSDQSLSLMAIRGINNQRGEFIFTTTPLEDLRKSLAYNPTYFSEFLDGGGYATSLVLLNTSSAIETGTLQIVDGTGSPMVVQQAGGTTGSSFPYSIPPNGFFRFQTDGAPADVNVGWVELIPSGGTPAPAGSEILDYNPQDALVSESGIPATTSTTQASIYVDLTENHNTGLAIANVSNMDAVIAIGAYQSDGITPAGLSLGPLQLPPKGQVSGFVDRFLSGLPAGFTGIVEISSTTPVSVVAFRTLENERHDFLFTPLPIAREDLAGSYSIIFPEVVDGGGYSTQFILLTGECPAMALNFFGEDGQVIDIGK